MKDRRSLGFSKEQVSVLMERLKKSEKFLEVEFGLRALVRPIGIRLGEAGELKVAVEYDGLRIVSQPGETSVPVIETVELLTDFHLLQDNFKFNTDPKSRYVLDFGRGLIPIQILSFETVKGRQRSTFVDLDASLKLISNDPAHRTLPLYQVETSVIRCFGGSEEEFQNLCLKYRKLKQSGMGYLPKTLKAGAEIMVPAGAKPQHLPRLVIKGVVPTIETQSGLLNFMVEI